MNILDATEGALRAGNGVAEALRLAIGHFRADSGTVHLLESDGLLHLAAAAGGIPEVVLKAVETVPVGKGMAGLAVERAQPVTACNIQTDSSGDVRPGARATGL
ncbi:MAG: GAF domain-containing protein, partial [Candidatus Solibacter usitatus]|nr:GAF domain-containing protein [Candidatus Solibacter usitatus]